MRYLRLIFLLFCCAFSFNAKAQEDVIELDRWADSAYDAFYHSGSVNHHELDSVMFLYPTSAKTEGREKLFRILASYYHNLGKPNYAYPYLIEIEKSVRARGDSARLSLILAGIGECYRAFGKPQEALTYAEEAVELADKFGSNVEKGYAHGRYGAILFELDRKDSSESLPQFRSAIYYYKQANDLREVANYMGDYANALYESGLPKNAITILLKAEKLMKDSNAMGHLHNVLGHVYLSIDLPDSAIYYASQTYQHAVKTGNNTNAFHATSILQLAYDDKGDIKQAYHWSLVNNKLMNEHYEDTRGADVRIAQLEGEHKKQEIENFYLRSQKEQEEKYSAQSRVVAIVTGILSLALLFILVVMWLQRKKLMISQKLIEEKSEELEHKNNELVKFISVRDKLISIVSHDLRSPLTTLKNLLEVFKMTELTQEELSEMVITLEAQYQRSIDMADNLLLWVKSQLQGIDPSKVSFDIVKMTKGLMEIFKPVTEESKITVELSGTAEAYVFADQEMIKFVLRNLLHNAIKFSDQNRKIYINIKEYSNKVEWQIVDEGPGISKETMPRLFEMTKKESDNEKRGAGLGLYLSKYFTELNNGSIEAISQVGKGTTFTVFLKKEKGQNNPL